MDVAPFHHLKVAAKPGRLKPTPREAHGLRGRRPLPRWQSTQEAEGRGGRDARPPWRMVSRDRRLSMP